MLKRFDQIDVQDQKEKVRRYFGANEGWRGEIYRNPNDRFARTILRRKEYVLDAVRSLGLPRGATALDLGCGSGIYLEALADEGLKVYGSDYSEEMVALCRQKLSHRVGDVTVVQGDIECLPFDDRAFDLVICVGVLGYLLRDDRALAEISRILKPGGFFLVIIENMMSLSNLDYVLRRRIRSYFTRRNSGTPLPGAAYSFPSPWVLRHSPTSHVYRLFHTRKFENVLRGFRLAHVSDRTFGFEFRLLRKFGIVPGWALEGLEVGIERLTKRRRIPLLARAGEAYLGVFQRQ